MMAEAFTYAVIGVLAMAATLVSLSYCVYQVAKEKSRVGVMRSKLHDMGEKVSGIEAEVGRLNQRVTPIAETLDGMQVRRFGDISSIPFLKLRHGTTGMAKLHNNSGRLVASLSEAFLFSAMGIKHEDFGKYDVEIRLKRITGTARQQEAGKQ